MEKNMDYHVILPEELGLSADELAVSWNEIQECKSTAEARLFQGFDETSEFITGEVVTLKGVEGNPSLESLASLVQQAVLAHGIAVEIQLRSRRAPDGNDLLMVECRSE